MSVLIIIKFDFCIYLIVRSDYCFNHTLCDSRLLSYRKHPPAPKGVQIYKHSGSKMSMSAAIHLFLLSLKPCSRGVGARLQVIFLRSFKKMNAPEGLDLAP